MDQQAASSGQAARQADKRRGESYKPVQTRAGPASRAIVLHREIAHIKCQRMGINDKKNKPKARRKARTQGARQKKTRSEQN